MDPLRLLGSVSGIAESVVFVCACLAPPRPEKPSLGLVCLESLLCWFCWLKIGLGISGPSGPSCFQAYAGMLM